MKINLSKKQEEAVKHLGTPALVVAGAGSGKTRTLTSKISFLIQKGIKPERILAITFTNKAANEMKERLLKETQIPAYRFKWVRTFHSACFLILKEHCHLLNYEEPLQIFSTYQKNKVLKEITARLNIDKKNLPIIMQTISMGKNSGNAEKYINNSDISLPIRLIDIFNEYERELKKQNAVDFDNILLKTRDLLSQKKEVREYYKNFFQYVLVDEYQDTNNLQEEITELLVKDDNLFCVGDDWQAVYAFRGSNINHFLSFKKKYHNAKLFYLEENYRSSNEIVAIANKLIDSNKHKIDKKCFSKQKEGSIQILKFNNELEEASFVVRKIINLCKKENASYDDCAIIYRTKLLSLNFEKTLRLNNIKYRVKGSKSFFERKEIVDITSYLIASVFNKDDTSLERIINIPRRGIGDKTIEKIKALKQNDMSLLDAIKESINKKLLSKKIEDKLIELIEILENIAKLSSHQAIQEVLKRANYLEYLKSTTDKGEILAKQNNIEELISYAKNKSSLLDFLEEAALIKEDNETSEKDRVNLLTAHSSKGLEFEFVFVVGCEEELFPHWKSMDSDLGLQEERRLMYVAMTRAKKHLFLTYAQNRKFEYKKKSRFLEEIEND